jgi:hypothetical protein
MKKEELIRELRKDHEDAKSSMSDCSSDEMHGYFEGKMDILGYVIEELEKLEQ